MPLEGESFEVVQASENRQEQVVMVVVKEPTPPADEVLQPIIVGEPLPCAEPEEEERLPTPEPEVVEEIPEEEREYGGRLDCVVASLTPALTSGRRLH